MVAGRSLSPAAQALKELIVETCRARAGFEAGLAASTP